VNTSPMDRGVSRSTSQALEPVHSMIYFVPEAQEEYAALGLNVKGNRAVGYFPARAAAMGAVSWPVVQATFFNFPRWRCSSAWRAYGTSSARSS